MVRELESIANVTCPVTEKKNMDKIYYRNSCNGDVLLINDLPDCENDIKTLGRLFTTLRYNVHPPHSGTKPHTCAKILYDFSKYQHSHSAVIVYYGYVDENSLSTIHEGFSRFFNDVNCPSLAGKPKIFIINVRLDKGHYDEFSSDDEEEPSSDNLVSMVSAMTIPDIYTENDMYFLTVVKCKGQRGEQGSLLTKVLDQVLVEYGHEEIMSLFRRIELAVKESQDGEKFLTEVRARNALQNFCLDPPKKYYTDVMFNFS